MTILEIEATAETVLRSHEMWRLPVDPLKIAAEEEIILKPGVYVGKFDARIEYYPSLQGFCIFYRDQESTTGRIHFSLAHELGHFYLPEHKIRLRSGNWHTSITDFRSRDPREQEADQFAAALLMPKELFVKRVRSLPGSVCDLKNLKSLAQQLGTSITSTALRYCNCDIEPCTVVLSQGGTVLWAFASEDMRYLSMSFVQSGRSLPQGSRSEKLLHAPEKERIEGAVPASKWFDWPKRPRLWEDAILLGDSEFMLTLLTPDD